MKKLLVAIFLLVPLTLHGGTFSIPSSRYVSLSGKCGLDPSGGIPSASWDNCTTTNCNTLRNSAPGDVTRTMINNAISGAPDNTVVQLPAGTITISGGPIVLENSNTVLRGRGPDNTIIDLSSSYVDMMVDLPCRLTALGSCSTRIAVDSEPVTKGSTSMSLDHTDSDFAGTAVVDAVCLVFQDATSYTYERPGYEWASFAAWEGDSSHFLGQWIKIDSVNASNGDITFTTTPLVMDLESGKNPEVLCVPQSTWIYRAGIEDVKFIDGGTSEGIIALGGCNECWLKNIETEDCGNSDYCAHVRSYHGQGNFRLEIRDSYFHKGESPPYTSGENYAFTIAGFNSFWKIENNIQHDVRHTIVYEGPATGMCALYNYDRSHRQDDGSGDTDYMGQSMLDSHGYHQMNNLWEGNTTSVLGSDCQAGSSSNTTYFRNYARGNKPDYSYVWGMWAVDLWQWKLYYNMVGNVLGNPTDYNGSGFYQNDSAGELGVLTGGKDADHRQPAIYILGATGSGDYSGYNSNTKTNLLRHMNYDYVNSAARTCNQEDEGCQGATSTDNVLLSSLYYTSKPGSTTWWCTETPWPPIGPDVSGYTNDIPAKRRYDDNTCTLASGSSTTPTLTSPVDNEVAGWPVDFIWTPVSGAVWFHIQVDNNSDFSSPEIDDNAVDPDTACDETDCHYIVDRGEGLAADTHYYWRVRARIQ